MNSDRGWRDPRTGRVSGFRSAEQRQNFLIGRARFCDGADRQMPVCLAVNKLGAPCRAAKMRGRSFCFRHVGTAAVKRVRLINANRSGDVDRIERAAMRSQRNQLRGIWRHDPRAPGRTIMLVADDEAACRAWSARLGFQLDVLDNSLPGVADPLRWLWARAARGLLSDDDLTAKLARLRNRIMEATHAPDHSG
jgi:hypothetical protein